MGNVLASTLIDDWATQTTDEALANGTAAAAIHAACFLCYTALASGGMSLEDVLGDTGLVHALAHAAAKDVTIDLKEQAERARKLEAEFWPADT